MFPLLLFLIASNTSPTWATNAKARVSGCNDADSSGVYEFNLPWFGVKNVFCDVTDDGGNWAVIQRRMNGKVDFDRGLAAIHALTTDRDMELEIKMITKAGVYWVAKYRIFYISPGYDNYRLRVYGLSGNTTYGTLSLFNDQPFSTKDADHDDCGCNCASDFEGAWWYNACAFSNLNGNFNKEDHKGIWWEHPYNLLRFSEMRIRETTWH